jgi:oxygen-dependent protoporphyrinogen oxidase
MPAPEGSMEGRSVVVVGAGLAGLAAAHDLVAGGASVTVLEKETCVGGRTRTDAREGFCVDLDPRPLWSADRGVEELLASLGLTEERFALAPGGRDQLYRGSLQRIDPRGALGG